ncbi:peptidylprolyl isomerase [Candidatus Woesearchaeota archaeon]|nr:peptidylprolyl isomerase [Candidatus Woesearchaeota archaeon]
MIKKGDFIEVEYTGMLSEDRTVFDTSDEAVAKKNGILHEHMTYGPAVICVGQHQLVPGLDSKLEGKEAGKEYEVRLQAEDAFGKKDAKLIQLIPTAKFKKQGIMPMPGLQVNIDGHLGIVRKEGGGRTLVDFNHPLAGRDVIYQVAIKRGVMDDAEKIKSLLRSILKIDEAVISAHGGKAAVAVKQKIPEPIRAVISEKIKSIIPSVTDVVWNEETHTEASKGPDKEMKQEPKEAKQ